MLRINRISGGLMIILSIYLGIKTIYQYWNHFFLEKSNEYMHSSNKFFTAGA
jgi:hypothetical protein